MTACPVSEKRGAHSRGRQVRRFKATGGDAEKDMRYISRLSSGNTVYVPLYSMTSCPTIGGMWWIFLAIVCLVAVLAAIRRGGQSAPRLARDQAPLRPPRAPPEPLLNKPATAALPRLTDSIRDPARATGPLTFDIVGSP